MRRHAELAVVRLGDGEHHELLLDGRERRLGKRVPDRERPLERGGRLGEDGVEVGNEAESLLDALEQRAAPVWCSFDRVNDEFRHVQSPWSGAAKQGLACRGEARSLAAYGRTHKPKKTDFISEAPDMDLLSDVLHSLRLRARIFKQGSYCGAWALDSTGATGAIFHLIGRGQAWVHRERQREPLVVRGGDLVMFPHADWHQLSGTPKRQPGMRLATTGSGPFTTVLCGMAEFEAGGVNPIMQALPPVIVVRSEDQNTSAELHALARLMLVEYEAGAAGRQGVLDRLAEVMFVLVLRHHMQRAPELKGFLAALKDERIARALSALHRAPGEDWRVDTLAREAGMSRTVFAERFAELVGQTPMQYLAMWRMHLADEMLRVRHSSVAQIAERLGYQTETAFRRAFRRVRGVGPGDVRRRAQALEAERLGCTKSPVTCAAV